MLSASLSPLYPSPNSTPKAVFFELESSEVDSPVSSSETSPQPAGATLGAVSDDPAATQSSSCGVAIKLLGDMLQNSGEKKLSILR